MAWALRRSLNTAAPFEPGSVVVLIECPANWFNDRGMDSKASEAIQKLYWTAASIVTVLSFDPVVVDICGVIPTAWKGQVDKQVMATRLDKKLRAASINVRAMANAPLDTWDAVGLAFWGSEHLMITHDHRRIVDSPAFVIRRTDDYLARNCRDECYFNQS